MSAATRARLKDVPVCAAGSLRVVKFGFAGRAATRVRFGDATEVPDPGTSGAYLFVLPATAHGRVLTVTYRDGTVCRDDGPPTAECFPPPGFPSHR
jgi:hypothetical protein